MNNNYGVTGIRVLSTGSGGNAGLVITGSGFTGTPVNLGPGAFINSSLSFSENPYTSGFKNSTRTVADFGPNSYLGFKTDSGQFGYFEVLRSASTSTFNLVSGAYESTAGIAIQIPNSAAAVPEPASSAVAALLMGGTALRQWRKKRRDQVATTDDCLAS